MKALIARAVTAGTVALAGCGTSFYVRPGLAPALPAAGDVVEARLLLAGDAGAVRAETDPEEAKTRRVFEAIRGDAARDPARSAVVFLGDNLYPRGLPLRAPSSAGPPCTVKGGDAPREKAEATLRRQIAASAPAALALFVPGNHDWDQSGECGWPRVREQEAFLESARPEAGQAWPRAVRLRPDEGCPGPAVEDLPSSTPVFRLVALNTEWLLRDAEGERRRKPIRECAAGLGLPDTADEEQVRAGFLKKLGEAVAGSGGRPVILVSHHPLETHGHHGGAGLTGIQAKVLPTSQDVRGKKNRRMVGEIVAALAAVPAAPLVVAAAGHDHDLQVLELPRGPQYQLVSGAVSKVTPVGAEKDTLFKHAGRGYLRIDFIRRADRPLVRAYGIGVDERGPHQLWSGWLAGPPAP